MNTITHTAVNKEVTVTSMFFRNGRQLQGFPKRIEFDGDERTFVESGFHYLVKKGQRLVEFFDMTDGTSNYRLKFDNGERIWTLVGVSELPRAIA
jgi:hypothetical protein